MPSPIVAVVVVFVTHMHMRYSIYVTVFSRWQTACVLIIATYIRIIGYSVLAWLSSLHCIANIVHFMWSLVVCICVHLPLNQWLMLIITRRVNEQKRQRMHLAHVLIWIKGERIKIRKRQDKKRKDTQNRLKEKTEITMGEVYLSWQRVTIRSIQMPFFLFCFFFLLLVRLKKKRIEIRVFFF